MLQEVFFTCEEDGKKNKDLFNREWLLHQNRNMHHPEYWVMRNDKETKILDIPNIYIIEMILDWVSMGFKFGNSAYDYYEKNKDQKPFSVRTKNLVESVIYICK